MKKFCKFLMFFIVVLLIIIGVVIFYGYSYHKSNVDKVPIDAKVLELRKEATYVTKDKISKDYLNAVVAIEDHRFYDHGPVDFIAIIRATVRNAKNKEFIEGGSTITQQVAKNLYYMEDSTAKRKIAEIFTAYELENKLLKDDILEIYANIIYFGDGYYGIKEACNGYLNKEPNEITLAEACMLAGIPNAPSVYSPTVNKEYCKSRTKKVIDDMVEYGYITKEVADLIDLSFIDNIK